MADRSFWADSMGRAAARHRANKDKWEVGAGAGGRVTTMELPVLLSISIAVNERLAGVWQIDSDKQH